MKKLFLALLLIAPTALFAADSVPQIFGIRGEFILFALTLMGVALFHHKTLQVALTGLAAIVIFKIIFVSGYPFAEHFFGHNPIITQIIDKSTRQGEWPIILNLLGLLLGFAILAKHFELSHFPENAPSYLPSGWVGGFLLLVFVFVLSSFLDNIAAAMIGGTLALVVYKHKVHIGYIAAIVAASNAGGSGSVVGDTTTTMMWIEGVSPLEVVHAYVAAIPALLVCGIIAAKQQERYHPITIDGTNSKIKYKHILVVVMILAGAILTNVYFDLPALGVWIALALGALIVHTPWKEAKHALPGSIFLLSLVTCASMMPVETLPAASWVSAFILGFVSAVFDNIPLTKLALTQGGFDWGMLAYTVGFGGSMIWFGSSAGVAISNMFPKAKSVANWLKGGWHVTVAYIIGFFFLLATLGWNPVDHRRGVTPPTAAPHSVQQTK
jgi:Na+/H+ antiporter NhaD/arsenite permease-like protein